MGHLGNGTNGPAGPNAGHASANGSGGGMRGYSGWDDDIEATRYLSGRTLLSIPFAKHVFERVVNERFRRLPHRTALT